ncbi:MAG TPA: DegQ family serine endoprotease [Pelovirga sp.]|nr:DegQ family serine endoprotease [Pelovirga sp.]
MRVSKFFGILVVLIIALLVSSVSAQDSGLESLRETGKAFRNVARDISPAVVYIQVEQEVQARGMDPRMNPFEGSPFGEEFFRRFFGEPPRGEAPDRPQRRTTGQGSGFLISADGYIMTNNHVVGDADKITVQFQDGREFDAELVGADPPTDVALIRITAKEELPFIKLGNSEQLEVGDWVLAFGNPFGLSHTMTAGIVSAKGRSGIGLTDYENFIQTDAAINPGNSGGPLVNLDGEAVGMNTAIFSRSGGYMGIGFAIPINMATNIYLQLAEHGTVTRGRIGVYIQDLTRELAESFDIDQRQGILVSQVMEDSAAEKGGLEQGDVILKLNGTTVENVAAFRNQVALTPPGTTIELEVLRKGKVRQHKIVVAAMEVEAAASEDAPVADPDTDVLPQIGLSLQKLTQELAEQLGYQNDRGVLVAAVEPGSVAARAGIEAGALIEEVNRVDVNDPEEVVDLVEKSQRDTVLLLIRQGSGSRYIALRYR